MPKAIQDRSNHFQKLSEGVIRKHIAPKLKKADYDRLKKEYPQSRFC